MSGCIHRWILGTVKRNKSLGRCRLCGKERVFTNEFKWTFNRESGQLASTDMVLERHAKEM